MLLKTLFFFLFVLFAQANEDFSNLHDAEKHIEKNDCTRALQVLNDNNINSFDAQLVRFDAFTKCENKDFVSANNILKNIENIAYSKEEKNFYTKAFIKLEELKKIHKNESLEKYLSFILGRGVEIFLIFLGILIGSAIAYSSRNCDSINHQKLINGFLTKLASEKKLSNMLKSKPAHASFKCFFFSYLNYFGMSFVIFMIIVYIVHLIERVQKIKIFENIEIFGLGTFSLEIASIILIVSMTFFLSLLSNKIKEDYSAGDELKIANLLQELVVAGNYNHLYECVRMLEDEDDKIFSIQNVNIIVNRCVDSASKEIIHNMFLEIRDKEEKINI